ncbi:hypothetical protein PVAP13_4NG156462 [Panicum virgatum]|uniref:Uncharacterized protein n=1 Tax=Panicum virgatum TaxID=38727 RepID=A0A8T0T9G4_PANVG|nr:hypothetical protein PVAP13_4NG156462 [Panicum virgatum]
MACQRLSWRRDSRRDGSSATRGETACGGTHGAVPPPPPPSRRSRRSSSWFI